MREVASFTFFPLMSRRGGSLCSSTPQKMQDDSQVQFSLFSSLSEQCHMHS